MWIVDFIKKLAIRLVKKVFFKEDISAHLEAVLGIEGESFIERHHKRVFAQVVLVGTRKTQCFLAVEAILDELGLSECLRSHKWWEGNFVFLDAIFKRLMMKGKGMIHVGMIDEPLHKVASLSLRRLIQFLLLEYFIIWVSRDIIRNVLIASEECCINIQNWVLLLILNKFQCFQIQPLDASVPSIIRKALSFISLIDPWNLDQSRWQLACLDAGIVIVDLCQHVLSEARLLMQT